MFSKESYIQFILGELPDFEELWQEHLKYWGDEERGITTDMAEFANYVKSLMEKNDTNNLRKVGEVIEKLITEGDEEVKYAVKMGFIEDISNIGNKDLDKLSKFFGPYSLEAHKELVKFWSKSS